MGEINFCLIKLSRESMLSCHADSEKKFSMDTLVGVLNSIQSKFILTVLQIFLVMQICTFLAQ